MSRATIDHRETANDLPPLEFILSDTDQAIARIGRECIEANRIDQNERDSAKQG